MDRPPGPAHLPQQRTASRRRRLAWRHRLDRAALERWSGVRGEQAPAAAKAAEASHGQVPPDLVESTGWRWRVLAELDGLSADLVRGYERADKKQSRQAWESRWAGSFATGSGAAIGSIVSAVGAGLIKTNTFLGWTLVILGVLFAIAGSVFSANTYVQNRNKKLRYLRLLYDIWDYAFVVLPTALPGDAYNAVDTIRSLWETAGT